ncbi:DUF4249 domain-containing protein [Chitinophaga sancti]|uniref:DUF4249 domain-containing protein n=1 Tax=Chitinophaga sancti TaxID=1004 RepID=A0A1K1S773_9BACT|nr:DUF4249 domain-containing protein [Chitinophaga sancti]WQD62205.1 DUF4249 domain-containing protein [Chitinophaga sancti]WQG92226.1 DUF4249 domain-containing protein [Chitinophaga sancti]SFW79916.1 protein of unknown function [Chitinophaga sancti]
MKQLLYIAIVITCFCACEKVIDINLNNAAKKYVVEGYVTDGVNGVRVRISQTMNIEDANTFQGISGAKVIITADGTTQYVLSESTTKPGIYASSSFRGAVGHTYSMYVQVGTDTFSAVSTMPREVYFDSLRLQDRVVFGKTRRVPAVFYTDPDGKGNSYHFIEWRNRVKESTIFVRNDDNTDGRSLNIQLVSFSSNSDDDSKQIKKGDTIRVEMQCIDAAMYKYWYSLDAGSTGEGMSATPANAVSNIRGGALGYFSAHSVQARTIVAD